MSRVDAIAFPDYTLVLTAVLAAGIALVAGLLPADVRVGPQLGSLVAAALTTVVVVVGAVRTAVAAVQAATAPRTWAADLTTYASRMEVRSWQVPAAAILLAIVASAAIPSPWGWDAAVVGGFIAVLAAPATGDLYWWAPSVIAVVASPLAAVTALFATTWSGALIRSSTAGLLGLYAVLTSLARPELTAGICSALALVAAAVAVLGPGWPERFGPYADRVGDAATGAAAFTLPIAVGAYAYLLGAPPGVLLPLTMLATALGVLAAALSQVAAPLPRTASAGGALAASVGCVLLSLQLPGAIAADVLLGLLLLLAAAVTAASRAFEATPGGLFEAAQDVPAAVGAFAAAVAGDQEVRDPIRRRRRISRLNGVTFGAAAATGALIFAMARLLSVAVPGIGLVTTMAMVFPISVGVRVLPEAWRRGPRIGASTVAGAIGLVTAGIAVTEGVRTLAAATPWWHADLVAFPGRVAEWAPYGWQVPVTLLLTAAAAVFLLPAPYRRRPRFCGHGAGCRGLSGGRGPRLVDPDRVHRDPFRHRRHRSRAARSRRRGRRGAAAAGHVRHPGPVRGGRRFGPTGFDRGGRFRRSWRADSSSPSPPSCAEARIRRCPAWRRRPPSPPRRAPPPRSPRSPVPPGSVCSARR